MKERIDILMVQRNLVPSREKAQAYIMAGSVLVDGKIELKAGTKYDEAVEISLLEDPIKYVSRGGLKLEAALDNWEIDLQDKITVDIGASTGGFTDLMLSRGASKVYAIDVGYGQLDYKLRIDPRVVNMERINVRYLDTALIEDDIDFISIDVSFISLSKILPVAIQLLSKSGIIIALVKPQFEAEKNQVGKGGIIRDPKIHKMTIEKVQTYAEDNGLIPEAFIESPITGTKGNIEFLMKMTKKQ